MDFMNGIMLVGLAGVAVPILIHLLNRFRYREVDWAAMELLRRAMVVRSRRVRIEDLILLALRCLAVALLALAMARPVVSAAGAKFFGGESRVGMVIAVDASYSMSHRPGVHSRFDVALQRVREIVKTLQPGDQVSVVLMGQRPRALLRNVSFDAERIEEHLQRAAVLPERLNLELCLEQVAVLVGELKTPIRECYVVSDAQDLSWRQVSERARTSLEEIDAAGRAYYLSVASGVAENLALTDFQMTSGARRSGSMVRFVAEVRNVGRTVARNVPVTLQMDMKTADRRIVDAIRPGQIAAVPLYGKFEAPGNVKMTARLDRDAVVLDDARHIAARVCKLIRVLVVDGDPARDLEDSETFYLVKALAPDPAKPAHASVQVRRVAYVELALHRPADHDLVVLANVPDVRDAQVKALLDFVRQGGGLLVFLGDKVDARLINTRLRVGEVSLLPAEVKRPITAPAGDQAGWTIRAVRADHPLASFLARLPKPLVDEARIRKLCAVEPHPQARTILEVAGADAPLLVEQRLGRGHVLLFTSSADRDWGSVAIHPIYLILLHESLGYLTRQSHERQFTVGEPLTVLVPPQAEGQQFTLTGPDGQTAAIQPTEAGGERVARCGLPELPGFHQLKYDKQAEPIMVAVNVDPVESDVATLAPDALRDALAGVPVRVLAGRDLLTEIEQARTGKQLWKTFMLAALAVLLVEALLAWYFSRRLAAETSVLPTTAREEVLAATDAAA